MNVRELECFLAVVDHGGITKAASALYLAQPRCHRSFAGSRPIWASSYSVGSAADWCSRRPVKHSSDQPGR